MSLEDPSAAPGINPALTPTEREMGALWAEVLQTDVPITSADNFFSLGGDSLAMTMVLFRVHEVFGVELPTATLIETPELGSFSALVDSALLAVDQNQTMESSTL
jgi:acyl carrier protein